jgi:2-phosphosulfolactate phosphatase
MVVNVDLESVPRGISEVIKPESLVIVIDVLRSTTSIVVALANGAKSVVPVTSLKEAYELHKEHPDYILVGERDGCKPRGFYNGNSPAQLAVENFQGKNIIITTTNGTKALDKSNRCEWVFIGAFLNARAIAKKALEISDVNRIDITFVLAGEKNRFSLEDFICAGAISAKFPQKKVNLSDESRAALLAFCEAKNDLFENIEKGEHARFLIKRGFKDDVEFSCRIDSCEITPFYQNRKIQILI